MREILVVLFIGLTISCNANAWFFFWIPIPSGDGSSQTSPAVPASNMPNGGQSQLQSSTQLPKDDSIRGVNPTVVSDKPISSSQLNNKDISKISIIYKPDLAPYYPSFSKREKEEGDVEVKLYVGEDGKVSDVTLIKETPYLRLNRAGIEVSKQYRFTPLLVDGKPTKFVTNLLIKFRLNSGDSASALSPPFVEVKKLDILFQPNGNDYYPQMSLNENEEGDVIAKLIINQDGVVEEVYYLEVTNYTRLNNAALEIGKAYKFKPYLVDGKAVKVSTNVLIKFRITDDDKKSIAKPSKISNDASVRLKKLKELLDNKLITQQDYDVKKLEILKNL